MNWFEKLQLSGKLKVYAMAVSAVFIIEGVMALGGVTEMMTHIKEIHDENILPQTAVTWLSKSIKEEHMHTFRHVGASDPGEMKALREKIEKRYEEITKITEDVTPFRLSDKEAEIFRAFAASLDPLFKSYGEVLDSSEGFTKDDAFKKLVTETRKLYDRSIGLIQELREEKQKDAEKAYSDSVDIQRRTWILLLTIVLGGIAGVVTISWYITRSITESINSSASTISSSASEIAAAVTQHERTAQSQAAAVNETTTTVEELGASARQSDEQAETALAVADRASGVIDEGNRTVRKSIEGITTLKEKVQNVAGQILHLSEQTSQIEDVTRLVSELANQTNLLALNAAVEAARAGEHGKGFAVVAVEIRKLADQSKKSADKIRGLVANIQKSTNSTVMVTEEGTRTVETMTELARKNEDAFQSLSSLAQNISEIARQISLNVKQQSTAITQIVEAMSNINAGSRETLAGITQTKVGITDLNKAANFLKEMI